jgi:hypothetical protein
MKTWTATDRDRAIKSLLAKYREEQVGDDIADERGELEADAVLEYMDNHMAEDIADGLDEPEADDLRPYLVNPTPADLLEAEDVLEKAKRLEEGDVLDEDEAKLLHRIKRLQSDPILRHRIKRLEDDAILQYRANRLEEDIADEVERLEINAMAKEQARLRALSDADLRAELDKLLPRPLMADK